MSATGIPSKFSEAQKARCLHRLPLLPARESDAENCSQKRSSLLGADHCPTSRQLPRFSTCFAALDGARPGRGENPQKEDVGLTREMAEAGRRELEEFI